MIIHICEEGPYIEKYFKFLLRNKKEFDLSKHLFLVWGDKSNESYNEELNIKRFRKYKELLQFLKKRKILFEDKIILHGLFHPKLVLYLFMRPKIIKKCLWIIWGGDLYFYRKKELGMKYKIFDLIRYSVISRIPKISALVNGDYKKAKEVYNSSAEFIMSFYPNPVDITLIESMVYDNNSRFNIKKVILVGNSGDPENNHIEIFKKLSFMNDDYKVIAPLSYGKNDYIEYVIRKGNELLGDKFQPITNFMQPEKYSELLNTVDIAIMNHKIQQALGNIISLLYMGKTVYLRSDTTPFDFFEERKINVFDTLELGLNGERVNLRLLEKVDIEKNKKAIREFFSEQQCIENWKRLFSW